jgi:hypothetical protein
MQFRSAGLWVVLGLGACANYDPPAPGVHTNFGEPRAELACEYDKPTAMVIKSWRCRPTANMPEQEKRARETLESINIPPPPPP